MQVEDFDHEVAGSSQAEAMMATVRRTAPQLLQRLQQGLSTLELVSIPHSTWPLPRTKVLRQYDAKHPLRISILDSSFNPPTLAHLALANSRRSQGTNTNNGNGETPSYDAKLLLLSVKNADKTLKPGDATYEQRLEMMTLLASSVTRDAEQPSTRPTPLQDANVAIAIIDEPTFVGKSDALLAFLQHRFASIPPPTPTPEGIELTFLVGHDTLERLFSRRYYSSEEAMMASLRKFLSPAPEGDNSRIVSARRDIASQSLGEDTMSLAKEFIDSGKIATIDLGDEISKYSSTTVRRSLGSLGWGHDSLWRKLVTGDVADYIVAQHLYEVQS
ncbi:Nicotinamide mononucleotide adenylyltransferase [Psilocybe cubensis]|uniref:Nicotinamide mononucleotide adenylyltransferase n=2 Tax=Psilocybe cubensis TaxID=181762 RepID=A0ACB8H099_PSICU|nr:Nicotinamide mononucleotide adenylyltransferase [Psilocybe cubensis]KAH9481296.1 Nicotinamide mononucleotide adenylyltransferase [Psilocybe cubensis]